MLELCEAWHHHMMYPGIGKQAIDMQRRFEIDEIGIYNAIKQVKKGCSACQACNPDNPKVRGKPNGRRFLTSPLRVWPWMSSPCPKYISEKKFSIV